MSSIPEQVRKQAQAVNESFQNTAEPANLEPADHIETPQDPEPKVADDENSIISVPSEEEGENFEEKYKKAHQRNKVMEGIHKRRIAEYQQKIKGLERRPDGDEVRLSEEIKRLETLNEQLLKKLEEKESQQSSQPDVADFDLEKVREDYGEEFAKVIERAQRSQQQIAELSGRLSAAESRMSKEDLDAKRRADNQERVQKLKSILSADGLDFNSINNDPGFVDWLDYTDPKIGMSLHQIMSNALSEGSLDQVASFFREYAEMQNASESFNSPAKSLAGQVTIPPGGGDSPDGLLSAKKAFTPEQVADVYRQLVAAKRAGNRAEVERLSKLELQMYGLA